MWSSGSWKWVGSSHGVSEVSGEYVWIDGEQDSYIQDRREILKRKYWGDSVNFLERAMGSSWWEWSVGSR